MPPRAGGSIEFDGFVYLCYAVERKPELLAARDDSDGGLIETIENAFQQLFAFEGGIELYFHLFAEVALVIACGFERTVEPRTGDVERIRRVVGRVELVMALWNFSQVSRSTPAGVSMNIVSDLSFSENSTSTISMPMGEA